VEKVIYLLDTDILITILRGLRSTERPAHAERAKGLVERCIALQSDGHDVGLSAITASELEFGARNSLRYEDEVNAVRKILAPFRIFDYEAIVCPVHYGQVRNELERRGKTIGAMDLLIAAHALALDAILVTNNAANFSRISGLRVARSV
jgi:tRNA(fMet)-specific endonuclease VapC